MSDFNRYEFKMFIPNTDILCFRAYVIDRDNYTIFEIPDLGIDETYKNIFLRVVKGEFNETFYKKSEINNNQLGAPIEIKIDSDDAIQNIEKFRQYCEYFGVTVKNEKVRLYESVTFRFEGPSLNAKYGLLRKEAKHIESIANSLINIVLEQTPENNSDFGTVLQMPLQHGSTKVQFDTEKINENILNVIRKVFIDINEGNIDIQYINDSENQYANLYKKFAIELKKLNSIKDLEEFQIKLFGDEGFDNELINFTYLKEIENEIYNNSPLSGNAKIKYYKGQLSSKRNINSLVVDYMNNEITLHFSNTSDDYARFHRISSKPRDTEIYFEGFKDGGDKTILIENLSLISNNQN